ncbi:MAG TPA: class I SAM-dependent methyltransferase [Pirellulales bacterium]|nr:class I SAM-dependent methyltransferase [Pirellulales bacterium]
MFRPFHREPLYHYPMDRSLIKSPILYRDEHRVVHIGGGPNRNHPKEWNLNLFPLKNIDVVGSAERLPLASESVDVIVSNAVLEHVQDLPATLREMNRVLKPGGYVYVEIPFIQQYHTHDIYGVQFEDYRRLTKPGLRQALAFCTPLDVGVCVGPTSTVLQMLRAYAAGFSSSARYQRWVERGYYFFGNLLVWIDGVLPQRIVDGSGIPSGIYYFGRKPDALDPWLRTLPMPNSIFPRDIGAGIRLDSRTPALLRVTLTNTSGTTWLQSSRLPWGAVNVAVQPGRQGHVERDFKRVALPRDIGPGESVPIEVRLADLPAGSTSVTVDLVIEGFCWFSERGNAPLVVSLAPAEAGS